MNTHALASPLRWPNRGSLLNIGFTGMSVCPEVMLLRQGLNSALNQLTSDWPKSLREEAQQWFVRCSGGSPDFFKRFVVPQWSFLYWVPQTLEMGDDSLLVMHAKEAHALALFLQWMDNELNHEPLQGEFLAVQLRTSAWQRLHALGRTLCQQAAIDPMLVDEHMYSYVIAKHRPESVQDFRAYGARFRKQCALITLVPRVLGYKAGGPAVSSALCSLIENVSIAWRWLDDIQDIHLDIAAGKETSVWLELGDKGRRLWELGQKEFAAFGELTSVTWQALDGLLRNKDCLDRLFEGIAEKLLIAIQIAQRHSWHGLKQELCHCIDGFFSSVQMELHS